ncbi:HEAT repeat domain-containing protein [Methylomonas sp. HW2-6]|uniref:HEAT repeat domain-containing protein n=1 Tax=Methylomonas sp. HW2-6 TaxID=3376687 RepID=UPI0040411B8D
MIRLYRKTVGRVAATIRLAPPSACRAMPVSLVLLAPVIQPAVAATAPVGTASKSESPQAVELVIGKTPGSLLQLNVRQAALADIVKEIAAKTKTEIHYTVLPEAPVTATCIADKVQALLECLVGKQIGVVSQKPEGASREQVWLLGSSMSGCPAATAKAAVSEQDATPEIQPTPAQQAALDRAQREHTETMLKQARSKDPSQRAEALLNLGSTGTKADPNVRQALEDAINDKSPGIRAQAVSALAAYDEDGAEQVLNRALDDKDMEVRLAAVDRAAGNQAILERAATDSNPTVAGYAAAKLAELARTHGQ